MNKKLKFMTGLLAVAFLSAPVLMGCGNANNGGNNSNPTSSQEAPSSEAPVSSGDMWDAVKTGDIKAPEYVVVGDEFDLDEFITIEGGKGPKVFDATLNTVSEGVASLDGHKVKVLKEGTISIKITVGPEKDNPLWQGKFSTKAISALKAAYQDYTKNISNQFMFFSIEEDKNGNAYAEEMIKHTSEYVWFSQWDYEDELLGTIKSGGIMRCGKGHTHFFEIDSKHTTITVDPERQSADLSLYYVAQDFNLPVNALSTAEYTDEETGEKVEYLTIDNTSAYLNDFIKYNVSISWNSKYTTHSVDIYPITPFEDGETYYEFDINVAYASAPKVSIGVGAQLILSTKDEHCKDSLVEEYIEKKLEPDALECSEVPNKFKDICDKKNYTVETTTGFSYTDPTTKNVVTITGDEYDQAYITNGGKEVSYVTADRVDTTYTYGTTVENSGYYNKDGKAYSYTMGADGKETATEIEGCSDIWSPNYILTLAPAGQDSIYSDFRVNERTENADGSVTFKLAGTDCADFLSCIWSVSSAGYNLASIVKNMTEKYAEELGGASYWDYVDTYMTVGANYVEYTASVGWSSLSSNEDVTVYANWTTRISNIGTTGAAI